MLASNNVWTCRLRLLYCMYAFSVSNFFYRYPLPHSPIISGFLWLLVFLKFQLSSSLLVSLTVFRWCFIIKFRAGNCFLQHPSSLVLKSGDYGNSAGQGHTCNPSHIDVWTMLPCSIGMTHEAPPQHGAMCLCRPLIESEGSIQVLMAFVPFLTIPAKALCIVFFLCSACTVIANMIIFCHHHALSGFILVKSAFKSLEKVSFSI